MRKELTDRQLQIIYELINEDHFLSSSSLAEKVEVSARTIRRELKCLKKFSKNKESIKLVIKPGQGIKLIVGQSKREKILSIYQSSEIKNKNFIPEERKKIISFHLFKHDPAENIEELEDELNISSSTLKRDFKKIKKSLAEFDLKLKSLNKQTKIISGNEFQRRLYNLKVINDLLSKDDKNDFIKSLKYDRNINIKKNEVLKEVNRYADLKKIYKEIYQISKDNGVHINSNNMIFLIIYSALSIKRIREGYLISSINNLNKLNSELEKTVFFNEYRNLLEDFYPKNNKTAEYTAFFLIYSLLSEHKNKSKLNNIIKEKTAVRIGRTVKKMTVFFESKTASIEYFKSKKMLDELEIVLIKCFIKSILDLNLDFLAVNNQNLRNIKAKNPYFFYLSSELKELIESETEINVRKNLLNYTALIFLNFVESKSENIDTLLISDSSSAVTNLLELKLQNRFSELNLKRINYLYLNRDELKSYDLIISNNYYPEIENMIVISPILDKFEEQKIKEKIKVIKDMRRYIF